MRKLILTLILAVFFLIVGNETFAITKVGGYRKKSGTYVKPYFKSSPDGSKYNNWSTKGNINPYTGKKGYKSLY